ncbi:CATRA conflict system CASPASE/TPR repeat-associated protein [Streptomyces sp. NPDC056049]|uniref:CATRA conflict system CASPASE/TPR repeat-associated protein n=1 Tax=Streptomyces sp. NPDC056049 TaxID=3345693 RepID=UPI0035DE6829
MSHPLPESPALVVHLFLDRRALTTGTPERGLLDGWWTATAAIGLGAALPPYGPALPGATTPGPAEGGARILAARRSPAPGGDRALVTAIGDAVVLSVLLASPAPDGTDRSWDDLSTLWWTATAGHLPSDLPGLLGSAELLAGTVPATDLARPPTDLLTAMVPAALPADGPHAAGRGGAVRLWELPPPGDRGPRHRRLLAVTDSGRDHELSHWAWQGDAPGAPAATRYLLVAAGIRHLRDGLRVDLHAFTTLFDDIERSCAEATAAHLGAVGTRPRDRTRVALEAALVALDERQDEAIRARRRLHALDASFVAAEENLALADPQAGELVAGEARTLRWGRAQTGGLTSTLATAEERLASAVRRTTTAVDRAHRARRDHLTLIQTSLLGALLTALAAIQSLQYTLRLPGPVRPALIAFLAALALVLPTLALPRKDPLPRHSLGRGVEVLIFGAAGAGAGWLILAITEAALNRHWPGAFTAVAAAFGAGVCYATRAYSIRRATRP